MLLPAGRNNLAVRRFKQFGISIEHFRSRINDYIKNHVRRIFLTAFPVIYVVDEA